MLQITRGITLFFSLCFFLANYCNNVYISVNVPITITTMYDYITAYTGKSSVFFVTI